MMALLSQTCKVVKQTTSLDSVGRPTYTITTVHESLRCRIDPLRYRSFESIDPGAKESVHRIAVYIEYVNNITQDMEIIIDGKTYNIISVNEISGIIGHHLEIEASLGINT